MRDNYQIEVWQAATLLRSLRQRLEPLGHKGGRRNSPLLEFNVIVDTPRCATPSVTKAGDDYVDLARQFFDELLGLPAILNAFLFPVHVEHVANAVTLL